MLVSWRSLDRNSASFRAGGLYDHRNVLILRSVEVEALREVKIYPPAVGRRPP